MKKLLVTLLLFLGCVAANYANNTFYIQCNKVFSTKEDVTVSFSSYYNNYRQFPDKVEMALYEVEQPEAFFGSHILQNYQSTVPDSIMRSLKLVKNWTKDVRRSYNQSVEIGKLDAGLYVLEAIGNGEASQIPIIVSNYGIITRNTGTEMLAYVSNRQTGKALEGFKVMAIMNNQTMETKTRSSVARFDLKKSANQYYSYVPIVAMANGEVTVSQSYFYYYYQGQNTDLKSYVFTDRSAYRPGQTAYFKGIFRQAKGFEYKLPTDSMVYQITDANGNEIAKKKVRLDDQASFNDSIYLDLTLALGEYKINTFLVGQGTNNAYWYNPPSPCTFSVEEYKKPEYEVNVTLDKAQYVKGDEIAVSIDAKYFFGAPVINGDVEYKIVREEYHIPWWQNNPYYWWYAQYYSYRGRQEVVQTGTGKLSWDGKFYVNVPTKGGDSHNYKYQVIANVRDASRRNISGSSSTIVAHTEFSLSARSEKYYYDSEEPIRVLASAKDFAGNAVETELTATLYNYRNYNKGAKALMTQKVKTNAKTGTVNVEFSPDKSGQYYVVLEAEDSRKRVTTTNCYAYVFNTKDDNWYWWTQSAGNIQIMTDKKVYNAGEKVKAAIFLPHEADALITVNNIQLAHYDVYEFNASGADASQGAMRMIEIPVHKNSFGQLDINVSYLHDNVYYTKKEQLTVIPQNQYLSVELKFDENQYRPGKYAEATLVVTDQNGVPVPNADVTLSTIDESIFSLYPDQTKDIRDVFYGNEPYQDHNYYQNYYNAYSYSREMSASGMAWRRKKIGDIFSNKAYLQSNQWYRYYHNASNVESFVSGFVVDHSSGEPIEGAKIQIGNRKFYTDKYGYYALGNIKKSHITIDFSHNGHTTTVENMPLINNQESSLIVAISDKKDKTVTAIANPTIVRLEDQTVLTDEESEDLDDAVTTVTGTASMDSGNNLGFAQGSTGGLYKMEESANESSGQRMAAEKGKLANNRLDLSRDKDLRGNKKPFKEAVVRTEFKDAIYWNPNLRTNALGEATVRIKLPDNLTTWRTTAKVISKDTKVGQTLAKVTVTKKLLVRMETPRFMTVGDRMLIATNIHNYLNSEKEVKVALTANGVIVTGTEQIIKVAANGEERIDWPVQADWILDAELKITALTDTESDAMQIELPVLPHGLEMIEAKSLYLSDTQTKSMDISIPQGIDLNSVNLEISSAPSISAALLSSMDDLIGYPYGCVEQTMSRFLPNVIVANTIKDVGSNHVTTIDADELRLMTAQGLKRLKELQHNDGGWGWWENDATHPFMTAYVGNGVHMAKTAGYDVDAQLYNKAMTALRYQVTNKKAKDGPTRAYVMMAAMQTGQKDLWKSDKVNYDGGAYETALWLQAAALVKDKAATEKLIERLEELAITEGAAVLWGGKKFYYSWQDDQVETTANAIRGLALADPDNDLLPGAVQWIMRQRKGNSWYNTRQTAMTIYGLNEIIKNEVNPDLELEIYANGILMETRRVKPADALRKGTLLNLKGETYLVSLSGMPITGKTNILHRGANKIKVVTKGKGSLYVNAKLKYFLQGEQDLKLEEKKQDFAVSRIYYKLEKQIDNSGKLTYKKVEIDPEKTEIKSGDDILVKVKVSTNGTKDYVLIEDPIPAGCEFIRNSTGYVIPGESQYNGYEDYYNNSRWGYWNWNRWYSHREYRDSKLAMTITNLYQGSYEYSYLMKAQIPGDFKITPAIAMLMYYPEVRGFSDFETMTIKE